MRTIVRCALVLLLAGCGFAEAVEEAKGFFREGQTFITWKEDAAAKGESYCIYRYTEKITAENLGKAKKLAEIKEGSSRFEEMFQSKNRTALLASKRKRPTEHIIPRHVIEPNDAENTKPKMVDEGTGLFVWTVKEKDQASFYAITIVKDGKEEETVGAGNSIGPIQEKMEPIGAVRYYIASSPSRRAREAVKKIEAAKKAGKDPHPNDVKRKDEKEQRDWYVMYMDYELWNPDYIGYAVPFSISCRSFKEGGNMPSAHLDGIGTMNVFTASYSNYGCGDFSKNALPTWYYGYGTKVKDRKSGMDVKQPVANYVQYRIMQTVLWARRKYKITDKRFHINGNSMGASGCIGFALAFPKFVTSIWSNEGITDYANPTKKGGKTMWTSSMWGNYGKPDLANPAKLLPFGDPQLDWYLKHDGMNVFDFRNVAKFLAKNVDVSFPFLVIGHCHQDGSIPAFSQAYPFEKYIRNSRQTFSYTIAKGGHGWGQAWASTSMKAHVTWDQSRPGFSNVPLIVGWRYNRRKDETSRTYMYKVAWGAKGKKIGGKEIPVVDTENEWRMPLIHESKPNLEQDYFVDITPRNLQQLKVKKGDVFSFRILGLDDKPLDIADFAVYANGADVKAKYKNAGEIAADEHNLLLIPNVPISRKGCIVEVKRK